jgi:hypothetical protein
MCGDMGIRIEQKLVNKHSQGNEYIRRTRKLLNVELNAKNNITSINT